MSLINDALKDLERRDASAAKTASSRIEHRRTPSTPRAWKWPAWILAALAVGVVLHFSLDGRSVTDSATRNEPLIARAEPNPGLSADAMPSSVSSKPAASQSDTQTRSKAERPINDQTSDAAPSPDGDTAAPARESATSDERGNRAEARQGDPQGVDERTPASDQAASAPRRSQQPPAKQPAEPTSNAGRQEPVAATISIQRAGGEASQPDALAAAKRLLARSQPQRAESRLRQLIDEQPELTEAHELLATTLIRRRRPDAAMRALEAGLPVAHEPAPLAALLGRLLIDRGEVARARSTLKRHAPPMAEALDYHLLLAAAHRQAGDHERAAEHYRLLGEHLPRRGAVWIGLGASLEALERPGEAADAYNRALEGDDDRAARFARERLRALQPVIGENQ